MQLQPGNKISNFTVTAVRPIPGQDATLVEMRYEKTGTELVWVKNKEANKLFAMAFKTIPQDSTGVFHILEHSVLCGSDKYPVKEPFVELLKSSMNTFLNAMTFSDKTLYPVSSRNAQDFLNLTSVYLDAVFAPSILHNPNIFRQEGWHYELDGEDLTYNGVVFNEMKGATSSVDDAAYRWLMNLLYPDNCYQHNSGGDPAAIPDLTYEQFVDSYKKCYHPTNARIFLDGDIPVERTFALLDEYLSRYDMGAKQDLAPQTPVSQEKTLTYEAANDGTPKAQLVLGKILGSFDDKVALLAREVLCDVLAGSNDAPLKRAVLETGLCQDLTLEMGDGMIQPFMMLRLHNIEDVNAETLHNVIRDCAAKLVHDGIPGDLLTASINHLAFRLQQTREPQALLRCINALNSWLYDGDPMLFLHFGDAIDALRAMAERKEFEALLAEMLLDDTGLCKLHLLPSETHGAKLREAELARLAAEKAALSPEGLQQIASDFEAFTKWQHAPDTAENLRTLPMLTLSEISPEPILCPTEAETCGSVTLLRHRVPSNGIIHLNAYFRLTDASLEELTPLAFMTKLLGKLPTAHYTADQLQSAVKTWLGSLRFSLDVFSGHKDPGTCAPVLTARCSVLQENVAKAEELILEILTATDFRQTARIREILLQTETEQQQMGMVNGHAMAYTVALSHFSAAGAAQEAIKGISFVTWLHQLSKDFDAKINGFTALAEKALGNAVCRSRMTLSVTSDTSYDASGWLERFAEGSSVAQAAAYTTKLPKRLGIRIPAQVSYAALGYHLADAGIPYDGTARALSNIASLAYLWNEVRVRGGAYGTGMRMGRAGTLSLHSYRDPSPQRSLETYRNTGNFIREFVQAGEDITGFIISSVADTEPLVGPAQQGAMADQDWFAGFGYEEALAERRALLEAKAEDLLRWCDVLDSLREKAAVCVVGYADALTACAGEELAVMDI